MKPIVKKAVFISIGAFLLAVVIALSACVGAFHELLDKFVVGYKSGESSNEAGDRLVADALSEQIQAEGIVLVKNEAQQDKQDNAPLLPMSVNDFAEGKPKVNVFGWAASDWAISGSGSGQVKRVNSVKFYDALKEAGVEYNTDLKEMYDKFRSGHREYSINGSKTGNESKGNDSGGSLHSFNNEFSRLYEPKIEDYSEDLKSKALEYSQTAIVVIGRVSGESNDSPKVQYKYNTSSGALVTDDTRTYLEISTEEEDLLKYVAANYDNVIVLINSTNVMELGFVETIKPAQGASGKKGNIDACLVVATTGKAGTRAIPKMLFNDLKDKDNNPLGSYNPSGKLADTYAYDLSTSSTYVDTGSGNATTHFYTNSNGLYPTTVQHTNGSSNEPYRGVAYEEYRESVYVGYKWYETADAEGFWTSDKAKSTWNINGYDDVVQYPFGYGLSYTSFSWDLQYISVNNGYNLTNADAEKTFEIIVNVTNTGKVAGQDVVELYFSLNPSKDAGIERASVNLLAFGKTQKILAPGESEPVKLTFKASDLASYDYEGKILNNGGYVLEAGTYTLSLRTDAHTLAGSKMTKTDKTDLYSDTFTFNAASNIHVLTESKNRFTGSNTTDGVAIDGNSDPEHFGNYEITYLSREDFVGTFPFKMSENHAMSDTIKSLNLYTKTQAEKWDTDNDPGNIVLGGGQKMTVWEGDQKTGKLTDLGFELGMDYDDDRWEDLLDCISQSEMQNLVLHGYTKTMAVSSIGKWQTLDLDGPNQVGSFQDSYPELTGFSSITLAQSWNSELAYTMGLAMGEEAADKGINGLYGPGVNVHRSPFGGRNYEYYSEDALMSGIMCARFVKAAKNRGVFCYLKHICLYESESGRDGMYTWVTEQALREIYLRPFEIAVKDGGSSAIMTSYGRIGAVWTGGSEALLTEVVRGEWGFKGAFLTDYADHHNFMNGDQMVRAGGDIWMDGVGDNGSFKFSTTSNAFKLSLRNATKNLVYMWLNALATNQDYNQKVEAGEIDDVIVIPSVPELKFRWYIPVVVVVDILLVGGAGVLVLFAFRSPKKKGAQAETSADTVSSGEPTSPNQE